MGESIIRRAVERRVNLDLHLPKSKILTDNAELVGKDPIAFKNSAMDTEGVR